jgi:hypothetical protein
MKTFEVFVYEKKEAWKKEFNASDEDFKDSYLESELLYEWRNEVLRASANGNQLPAEVLESFREIFGLEDYLSTFRGLREQKYILKQKNENLQMER